MDSPGELEVEKRITMSSSRLHRWKHVAMARVLNRVCAAEGQKYAGRGYEEGRCAEQMRGLEQPEPEMDCWPRLSCFLVKCGIDRYRFGSSW